MDNVVEVKEKKPEEMSAQELEKFIKEPPKAEEKPPVEEKPPAKDAEKKPDDKKPEEKKPEDLILGKFKSPDDVVKAYQELEKKLGDQGQQIGQLSKKEELRRQQLSQFFELDEEGNIIRQKVVPQQGTAQAPQQQSVQTNAVEHQLAMLRQSFPEFTDDQIMSMAGLMALFVNTSLTNHDNEIKKRLEPLYEVKFERDVEKQIQKVRTKYDDFPDMENDLRERLEQISPEIRAQNGAVETVFLTMRGERLPDVLKRKLEAQSQQTQVVEQKKDDAFVEGGSQTSVQSPPVNVEGMTAAQLEEYIKSINRK